MIGLVYCRGSVGVPHPVPPYSITTAVTFQHTPRYTNDKGAVSINPNIVHHPSLTFLCTPLHLP